MPTRVFLVRHGATAYSAEDRFAGSTDVPLSPEGHLQVARLAERLKSESLDAIYASPLQRTMQTARALAGPHGLEPVGESALREMNYGRWEAMSRPEVERAFREAYAAWEKDPISLSPQDGESGLRVLNRALPALWRIVERHRNGSVLIVSHKGPIRLLVSSLLGLELRGFRDRLDLSPAALSVLDFPSDAGPLLRLYNDVSHYESIPQRAWP